MLRGGGGGLGGALAERSVEFLARKDVHLVGLEVSGP